MVKSFFNFNLDYMATRAIISYKKEKGWEGVYSHWDGYPTNLGKQIWDILHTKFIGNKGVADVANDGAPHKAIRAFVDIYINGHKGGWSSFPETCYCHDPNFVLRDGEQENKLSDKDNDPLYIEWVYIVDPITATMEILEAVKVGENYEHKSTAIIDLLGKEPDWEAIEKRRV